MNSMLVRYIFYVFIYVATILGILCIISISLWRYCTHLKRQPWSNEAIERRAGFAQFCYISMAFEVVYPFNESTKVYNTALSLTEST